MTAAEEWRPVVGFPDYEVSSLGRVVSRRTKVPKEMRGTVSSCGYPKVFLTGPDGKYYNRFNHRLVMEAFVGPKPAGHETRHLDGDKFNNAVSNLAYGTSSENELDKVRHGTHQMARKTHCKRGHEYTDASTRRRRGKRECLPCVPLRLAEQARRQRAA